MSLPSRDIAALLALTGCGAPALEVDAAPVARSEDFAAARERMVDEQLLARDIRDTRVLDAMRKVPRHEFVSPDLRGLAYDDRPLPIGHEVTISQPYIVALMSQLASVQKGERVLDVGTGSGYQAAVLAQMGAKVWGIEIIEPHAEAAAKRLEKLGYTDAHVRHGDGWKGWPEHAPFDAIIVAAAPQEVPPELKQQLAIGGRLVVPVGSRWNQELRVITRSRTGFSERTVIPVAFVPMTGEAQARD